MDSKAVIFSPFGNPGSDESGEANGILNRFIYRWPLFLISVIVALGIAYYYLKRTKPVYEIKAKVLIKDDKKVPNKESALKEMDFFEDNKAVDNEVEVLKSRKLLTQVISRLHLWQESFQIDNGKEVSLYGQEPVLFTWLNISANSNERENLTIQIIDSHKYKLITSTDKALLSSFDTKLSNKAGSWKLTVTPDINRYIGQTIKVYVYSVDHVADAYASNLTVETLNKAASVIGLSFTDNLPQRGKDILNTLIDSYSSGVRDEKNEYAKSTLAFIDPRISSISGELSNAEQRVEGYRSSEGLTDMASQSKIFLTNVQTNEARLNDINVQLNVLNGIDRYISSPNNVGNAPSTIGVTDQTLIELTNRLIQLQLQREKLLATTPETSPDFEAIDRQIKSTKASIKENVASIRASLIASRDEFQRFNSHSETSIKKMPVQERKLQDIKRQQDIKDDLYVYLLKKKEEISLSLASKLAEAPVVDPAYASEKPIYPKKPITYAMALFIGLMLPAGMIYGNSLLSNRVTSRKDVENTGVPILGELVYEKTKSPIVVNSKTADLIIDEQFRTLRTNLKYVYEDKKRGRVTLLTSSTANEGKSFTTSNLAIALAASGRKTLILELDLRKPSIAASLNIVNDHPGLTDYLTGKVTLENIVQETGILPELNIISAGRAVSNPSELLERERLDLLFDWLKTEYDDILIDTPPVQLVSDALIISRVADVSLYIVRQGFSYKSSLELIKQLKKEEKLPGMRIIFNGVQLKGKYDYGYDQKLRSEYYTIRTNQNMGVGESIKSFFARLV